MANLKNHLARWRLAFHCSQEASGLWEEQPDLSKALSDTLSDILMGRDGGPILMRPDGGAEKWREWARDAEAVGARRVHFAGNHWLQGRGAARVWLVDEMGAVKTRLENACSDAFARSPVTELGRCGVRLVHKASGGWEVWTPRGSRAKMAESIAAKDAGSALAWGLCAAGDGHLACSEWRRKKNAASWRERPEGCGWGA